MATAIKQCIPCEGLTEALTAEAATARLASSSEHSLWSLSEQPGSSGGNTTTTPCLTLVRAFTAKHFQAALDFVNAAGAAAERQGHHPDFHLTSWREVRVVVYTHAVSGLTENDFLLAAAIDDCHAVAYSPKYLREHPAVAAAAAAGAAARAAAAAARAAALAALVGASAEASRVLLFTKAGCVFCERAAALLRSVGVPEASLEALDAAEAEAASPGMMRALLEATAAAAAAAAAATSEGGGSGDGSTTLTFPRIFVGGALLGGHAALLAAAGSGALFGLLAAAAVPLAPGGSAESLGE